MEANSEWGIPFLLRALPVQADRALYTAAFCPTLHRTRRCRRPSTKSRRTAASGAGGLAHLWEAQAVVELLASRHSPGVP